LGRGEKVIEERGKRALVRVRQGPATGNDKRKGKGDGNGTEEKWTGTRKGDRLQAGENEPFQRELRRARQKGEMRKRGRRHIRVGRRVTGATREEYDM
jgi:hypothetical protein